MTTAINGDTLPDGMVMDPRTIQGNKHKSNASTLWNIITSKVNHK